MKSPVAEPCHGDRRIFYPPEPRFVTACSDPSIEDFCAARWSMFFKPLLQAPLRSHLTQLISPDEKRPRAPVFHIGSGGHPEQTVLWTSFVHADLFNAQVLLDSSFADLLTDSSDWKHQKMYDNWCEAVYLGTPAGKVIVDCAFNCTNYPRGAWQSNTVSCIASTHKAAHSMAWDATYLCALGTCTKNGICQNSGLYIACRKIQDEIED